MEDKFMISIRNLKSMSNGIVFENRDISKINQILSRIQSGKITKENFWDEIRILTKKVYSDHSISRWQCISEWFYKQLTEYNIEL